MHQLIWYLQISFDCFVSFQRKRSVSLIFTQLIQRMFWAQATSLTPTFIIGISVTSHESVTFLYLFFFQYQQHFGIMFIQSYILPIFLSHRWSSIFLHNISSPAVLQISSQLNIIANGIVYNVFIPRKQGHSI